MSDFTPGEIVNITIKGVRVVGANESTVTIVADHPDGEPAHYLMPPQAAVTRGDPEWWPPRPGDLLREGDGLLWFACANGSNVLYRTAWSERMEHQEAWEKRHLLTLVHREDEQDGKSKTPTAGTEVPNRPGRVVGDCGHPVWRAVWDGGERTCQPCQDAFAAEMSGGDQPLLLDPDCRDGKHGSCVGGLCECVCHEQDGGRSDG